MTASTIQPNVMTLDVRELGVTEVNRRLRDLPAGASALIVEPRGAHNLGVGMTVPLEIIVEGNSGYYLGGLCDGPDFTVRGSVGWGAAENLMSGTVRILGNASESAAASAHGGLVIVEGDASSRAGISLKGANLVVAGDVGHMSGLHGPGGTILVCGDAGDASATRSTRRCVYVRGRSSHSARTPAKSRDGRRRHLDRQDLCARPGRHRLSTRATFKRIASARELYTIRTP